MRTFIRLASTLSLLVPLAGCAAAVAPEGGQGDDGRRSAAPSVVDPGPAARDDNASSATPRSLQAPSYCGSARHEPELGPEVCERRVVLDSVYATACFQGSLAGKLRFACNGGPAILTMGTRVLYGTVNDGHITLCGSDRFVLDERRTCSDGKEWFSGFLAMEGELDGRLAVNWDAVPLSRDPQCSYFVCDGTGTARLEEWK